LLLATRSETWNFFRSLYTVVVLLVGGVRKSNRTRGEWSKEGEKRIFFCECESYSFIYIVECVYSLLHVCLVVKIVWKRQYVPPMKPVLLLDWSSRLRFGIVFFRRSGLVCLCFVIWVDQTIK
jgi:hypothetical protein